jgi:hypothetical protein
MNTDPIRLNTFCPRCGIVTDREVSSLFADAMRKQGVACESCKVVMQREAEGVSETINRHEREVQWRKLVPCAYRLRGQPEEGLTDRAMMEASPEFRDAMRWSLLCNAILAGPSGALKTRTAFRLLRRGYEGGRTVAWWSSFGFQGAAEEAAGDARRRGFMASLMKPDVVLFDDLLKAPWTVATWSAFFELLEQRFSQGKPVIVTCNDGPDEITAALEATRSPIAKGMATPIIRRLTESALLVEMHPPPPPQPQLALAA